MYPKEYFLERFQNESEEELLHRYAISELTDQAKEAILLLLKQRGMQEEKIASLAREARKASYRETKGNKACDFCGNSARFSPVIDSGQRFCSKTCLRKTRLLEASEDIPEEEIIRHAYSIKNGECPDCHKNNSPVEVRWYYRVWSAVLFTRWEKRSHVCCVACGRQTNFQSLMFSLLFGWWGVPWGILITPAQIISNIVEMLIKRAESQPSEELIHVARISLASALAKQKAESVDA